MPLLLLVVSSRNAFQEICHRVQLKDFFTQHFCLCFVRDLVNKNGTFSIFFMMIRIIFGAKIKKKNFREKKEINMEIINN